MRPRVALALVLAALAAPAAARAQTTALGLPCAAQPSGVRLCSGTVASFDGQPLDVNVALPASGSGPFPLVLILHGFASTKKPPNQSDDPWIPTAQDWARKGYAVLNPTDRGFGDSCGSAQSRASNPACATGWIHLMDMRFEVRDAQELAGRLADEGWADPRRVGATGESYGGGESLLLGTLRDRIMDPSGALRPWTSPQRHLPMRIAAATPTVPWSDLITSLMPNGRDLDYALSTPSTAYTPVGVLKQSFVTGLYALGQEAGYYAPPRVDPDADLTSWVTDISAGEPYEGNPDIAGIITSFKRYRGPFYLLDGATGTQPRPPAPMLLSNGFTDDLFPPEETLRYANLERALFPKVPLSLVYMDYGHQRGANKPADTAYLKARIEAWIDHYVAGTGPPPSQGVTALTQTCPASAPSGGPFMADTWAALHPGALVRTFAPAQTVAPGNDPSGSPVTDPVEAGQNPCGTESDNPPPGAAVYRLPAATGAGYTLLGSPTIVADLSVSGLYPELVGRLWDVAPGGTRTLVSHAVYRPDAQGRQVFQLNANGWRFAPGHVPELELLGSDPPFMRRSNGAFSIAVSNLTLSLPTRETAGNGITAATPLPLPAGRTRAPGATPVRHKKHRARLRHRRHHHAKKHHSRKKARSRR